MVENLGSIIQGAATEAIKTADWVTKGEVFPGLLTVEETERVRREHRQAVTGLINPLLGALLHPRTRSLLAIDDYISESVLTSVGANVNLRTKTATIARRGLPFAEFYRGLDANGWPGYADFVWSFPIDSEDPVMFKIIDGESVRAEPSQAGLSNFQEKVNKRFPGLETWNYPHTEWKKHRTGLIYDRSLIAERGLELGDLAVSEVLLRYFLMGTKELLGVANQRIPVLTRVQAERLMVVTEASNRAIDIVLGAVLSIPEKKGG